MGPPQRLQRHAIDTDTTSIYLFYYLYTLRRVRNNGRDRQQQHQFLFSRQQSTVAHFRHWLATDPSRARALKQTSVPCMIIIIIVTIKARTRACDARVTKYSTKYSTVHRRQTSGAARADARGKVKAQRINKSCATHTHTHTLTHTRRCIGWH